MLRAGVAIGLTASLALAAWQDAAALDAAAALQRAKELEAASRTPDPQRRDAAFDALAELQSEVELALSDGARANELQLLQALSRAAGARADGDERASSDERIALSDLSQRVAKQWGSAEGEARARAIAARLCLLDGRVAEARDRLEASLREVPTAVKTRPFTLSALAESERQLGGWVRAFEALDRATAAAGPGPEYDALRRELRGTRAQIYLQLGLADLAAAILDAAEAELASSAVVADSDRIRFHIQRGVRALVGNDFQGASALVDAALGDRALYDRNPGWRAALWKLSGLAQSNRARSDPTATAGAEALMRDALAVPELPERERLNTRVHLADLCLRQRDFAEAARLLEANASEIGDTRAGGGEAPFEDRAELETLRARLALDRGDARAELEHRRDELERAAEAWLAIWQALPPRLEGWGLLHHPTRRAPFDELTRLDLALEGEEVGARTALERWMRVQALGSQVRSSGGSAGSVDEVRAELLGERRGALVYLPGPARSHVFALDRERIACAELEGEIALDDLRAAYAAVRRGSPSDADARAKALARALVPERIEALLAEWEGVTLVGLDLLGDVPFESLPLCGAERVGARIAVDWLPSLPFGLLLARRTEPASAALDLALVCAPIPGADARERWPELDELPFDDADRDALTRAYGENALVLRGADATRENVLEQALGRASVVQLVAHGVQDFERERPAVLVLTPGADDDGLLACADVPESSATRLVMLTSCRNALGPARRGDDAPTHLGGAWLAAGAQCVIASPAELSYGAALRISAVVHERLRAGDSPAEALRAARERFASDPAAAGAPLRVFGLGQRALFERAQPAPRDVAPSTGRPATVWVASGAIGLAGAALLVIAALRRRS